MPSTRAGKSSRELGAGRQIGSNSRHHVAGQFIEAARQRVAGARGGRTAGGNAPRQPALLRRQRRPTSRALAIAAHLGIRAALVFVLDGLHAARKLLAFGDLCRTGLLAGGQQLLQLATGRVRVSHHAVFHVIGMADEAVRRVGEIVDVATIDNQALSAANIGDVQQNLLRAGGVAQEQRWNPEKQAYQPFHGDPRKLVRIRTIPPGTSPVRQKPITREEA